MYGFTSSHAARRVFGRCSPDDLDGRWPSLAELADGSGLPDILVGGEELSAYEAYTEANRLIIEQNWAKAEAILETMMGRMSTTAIWLTSGCCVSAIKGRLERRCPCHAGHPRRACQAVQPV